MDDRWVDLGRRREGLPPETELVEGVPGHLFIPLKGWVDARLLAGKKSYWNRVQLQVGVNRYRNTGEDLLTVVDFVLYWYPRMSSADREQWASEPPWSVLVADLEKILSLGRSAWRVNVNGDGLERRIEQTATMAAREAVDVAPSSAQDHLRAAWAAAYGRHPDPDKVFNEAIRAVEDVACPLVEQKNAENGRATLGTVIGELRNNSFHKWELVLPGRNGHPRDITQLIGMMELLWHAQVSRHGGASKSRRQSQEEALAAVHLAVVVTQWLSTGVLRRRTN